MFVEGKKGEQWQVAEDLQQLAQELVNDFDDEIGHVEVDKVIFLRVEGSSAKWLGKCFQIKIPFNIVPKYMIGKLNQLGIIPDDKVADIPENLYDIRYVIALNNDQIMSTAEGPVLERLEKLTLLHELAHIGPDMEGLTTHDCQDFKFLVDKYGPHWDEGIIDEEDNLDAKIELTLSPSVPSIPVPPVYED
jgi:hypothetical protein